MSKIKLLDCTLRDGGYINDWKFGSDVIEDCISKLEDSGVDILEIGFFKDEIYKKNRTVYNDVSQITKQILPKKPSMEYAAMIEVINPLPLEKLDKRGKDTVDIIRVVVWKRLLQEGFEYCKGIVEKGYKLYVQPARVEQYSYDEFVDMVKMFNSINPLAVYIVDSFGTQTKETLIPYMKLANEYLKPEVAVGYHGHNNMMQAFDVAKEFCEMNLKRDLYIDASIYGMGRGAGNLNLELFAKYLNEKHGRNYRIEPMLKIYDKYLSEIYAKYPWGYSLPYYLTATHNCNPNYANYFMYDLPISADDINGTLALIEGEDKIIFAKEKANCFFKEYAKQKMNLVVGVPTYNRSKAVDNLLFNSAWQFRKYGIDIVIYDSSDNDKTEVIVRNFQIDGCDNIKYKRYEGEFDGFSLDHKIIEAYKEYVDQYDYIWICRDGLIITIDDCYDDLLELIQESFDYIVVDASFRNKGDEYKTIYDTCQSFFEEQAVRLVTLGTLILSSKMAKTLIAKYPVANSNYSLWQMAAPFHYFSNHKVKAVGYVGKIFMYNVAGTLNSFWNSAGKALEQWVYHWYKVISNLPEEYSDAKKKVLKIDMFDFHPFYVSSLLRMRGNGGLNIRLIQKHKKYIPYVCNTQIWKFYLVAVLPRWFAKYLGNNPNKKTVRAIKALYDLMSDKYDEGENEE